MNSEMTIEKKDLTKEMVAERLGWESKQNDKGFISWYQKGYQIWFESNLPDFINDLNSSKEFLYRPMMVMMIKAGNDEYQIGKFLWRVMNRENSALAIAEAFMKLEDTRNEC